MIRRFIPTVLFLFVLGLMISVPGAAAQGKPAQGAAASADSCNNTFKSDSGSTTVSVCPSVVQSGQGLRFTIHSNANQQVTVLLRYPNGTTDSATGTTDGQGGASIDMTVRYNPLYRYGSVPFTVTVGADSVSGTVRVAQSASSGKPRLRVRPAGARDWCPEDGRCTARNKTSIVIRVDTEPNAQVQVDLAYPNGVTLPCPGNDLPGSSGAFADGTGAFECTMPVSYEAPNAKGSVAVLVQATVTTSSDTIPLQYKLWLKGK
jgi:hypothetical protein